MLTPEEITVFAHIVAAPKLHCLSGAFRAWGLEGLRTACRTRKFPAPLPEAPPDAKWEPGCLPDITSFEKLLLACRLVATGKQGQHLDPAAAARAVKVPLPTAFAALELYRRYELTFPEEFIDLDRGKMPRVLEREMPRPRRDATCL